MENFSMTRNWHKLLRSLRAGALGLGLVSIGTLNACYATFADYQTALTNSGKGLIGLVSDNFGVFGKEFDTVVRAPATTFVQSLWANYVDSRLPDDIPNNPIVKR